MTDRSVAHYNLLELIGREAIGEVYRARDTKVGRTVALKVYHPRKRKDFKLAASQSALDLVRRTLLGLS